MSQKNKRKKQNEQSGGGTAWLCTFNDLMTLLMVFFVLIFSMGSLDLEKSSGMISSLQSGLGVLEGGKRVDVSVVDPKLSVEEMENDMGNLREVYSEILQDMSEADGDVGGHGSGEEDDVKKEAENKVVRNYYLPNRHLQNIKLLDNIETSITSQGIYITLKENLLFESGSAKINISGYPVLQKVAKIIKKIPYDIRIEGHTDNVPIHTESYPTNWELSIDRAIHILKYFIKEGNIIPEKMSAVGYGDVKPVSENNSPENRAKNRRVEIVLVNKRIR